MKFRTEIGDIKLPFTFDPNRGAVMLGSCFADNIGEKLRDSLWAVCINPFGTLFNPMSIANAIDISLGEREMKIDKIDGKYIPWDFSTLFEGSDITDVTERCNLQSVLLKKYILEADALMVTFGTPIVYHLCSDNRIVANCHKIPQKYFRRCTLSIDEIVDRWSGIIRRIREFNPDIKIILSVSPVRHLADGFVENNRSKARLFLACEEIVARDETNSTCYFPSYEIVCDDLRDYRFYSRDLVHPSPIAVDYIWDKFCSSALDDKGRSRVKEGEKLRARVTHRFLNPDSPESKDFMIKTDEMIGRFLSETSETCQEIILRQLEYMRNNS